MHNFYAILLFELLVTELAALTDNTWFRRRSNSAWRCNTTGAIIP